MANKHQVLELLAKGLTPRQVAKKLGCRVEYVRATRRRATPAGLKLARTWAREQSRRMLKTVRGKEKNRVAVRKQQARVNATEKGRAAMAAYRRGERHFPRVGVDYD